MSTKRRSAGPVTRSKATAQPKPPVQKRPTFGRQVAAGLLGLAAIGAAVLPLAEPRKDGVAASRPAPESPPPSKARTRAQIDVDAWLMRLKAREMRVEPSGQDLFAGMTWEKPAPVAAPAAGQETPAFPFQVIGQISIGERTILALEKSGQAYSVKQGDVVDDFRIDHIGKDGFSVTHVPTKRTWQHKYEDAYPSSRPSPNTQTALPDPVIVAPQLEQVAPIAPKPDPTLVLPVQPAPATGAAGSIEATPNVMVPFGGIQQAPELPPDRATPSSAPSSSVPAPGDQAKPSTTPGGTAAASAVQDPAPAAMPSPEATPLTPSAPGEVQQIRRSTDMNFTIPPGPAPQVASGVFQPPAYEGFSGLAIRVEERGAPPQADMPSTAPEAERAKSPTPAGA